MAKKNKGELSKLFAYAGMYRIWTVLGCILSAISSIFSILPFVCIWLVIRAHIQAYENQTVATASTTYAWFAVLFAVIGIVLYFLALICTHLAAFRTATNIRKTAMHHILTLPLGYFQDHTSGSLRKIIDENAGLTEEFLAHQLPDIAGAVVMPFVILGLLFVFDWRLGICCLVPMGMSILFLKRMMGGENAEFMSKYMTALETMNQEAVEYIRGIPIVKVFQQTVYSFQNFRDAIATYETFASNYAIRCRIPLTGFTVTLHGAFVLLIPVGMLLLSGVYHQTAYEILVLDFLFYVLFAPVCATMMQRFMFAGEQLMTAKSAVQRVEAVLQAQPFSQTATPKCPADASITFSDVSFAYTQTQTNALQHISFTVPQGQTVALVGASGSGKSTIARLVARFYDVQEGSVKIGGVDVREIEKQDLMAQIAFVFQNTKLFKDTLRNNVNVSCPNATDVQIQTALQQAQCMDIIERLPNGLDTLVGTGGTYLSGGECQRIALARAILKDAPIVILDEATAFADAENAHRIQMAFDALTKQKTVLMIAHRLSSVQNANQILVCQHGEIVERGTHTELLALQGVYYAMWQAYQTAVSWQVGKAGA